jgi:predicted DNA-binding transcriptional regulator AlpA
MPAIQSKSSVAPAALAPAVSERFSEILTIDELANFLKCSRRSVYNLTRKRNQAGTNPCPVLRTPVGIRFLRSSVEAWLQRCVN